MDLHEMVGLIDELAADRGYFDRDDFPQYHLGAGLHS